jgi:hypothetical protein
LRVEAGRIAYVAVARLAGGHEIRERVPVRLALGVVYLFGDASAHVRTRPLVAGAPRANVELASPGVLVGVGVEHVPAGVTPPCGRATYPRSRHVPYVPFRAGWVLRLDERERESPAPIVDHDTVIHYGGGLRVDGRSVGR